MRVSSTILDLIHGAMDLPGQPGEHRVVCAMSGGVDSSVTAALLSLAGYDTVGITLQLYDHGEAVRRKGACCAGQDIHDARRVASTLGIPHYVLDYESRFQDAVVNDFVDSYLRGATPIPCVKCNQTVKFHDLLQHARDLGASTLATGHYVESRKRAGTAHRDLFTPADMARDQSYFLYATTQEQVDFLRFPLGRLAKEQIRNIAGELGLPVAAKPDSQDICFVPDGDYAGVILKHRPDAAAGGDIVHVDGRVLGRHNGILHFTIGQRRGLGIADGEALYVIRIDAGANRIVAGPREALRVTDILIHDFNWLGESPLNGERLPVFAKIRSTRAPGGADIYQQNGGVIVTICDGEYGASPGQACVLYSGQGPGVRLLGGGTIKQAN
jgi:tRNA-specific 2-thiouridylase